MPGGNPQRAFRKSGAGAVGDNAAEHRAGVLQRTAEIAGLQVPGLIFGAEQPAGHDNGHIWLAGTKQDGPGGEDCGNHQAFFRVYPGKDFFRQCMGHAGALEDSRKAQGNEHQGDGLHHAQNAAPVQQGIRRRHAGGTGVAVHNDPQQGGDVMALYQPAAEKPQCRSRQQSRQSGHPKDYHQNHQHRRNQQQGVDGKGRLKCA